MIFPILQTENLSPGEVRLLVSSHQLGSGRAEVWTQVANSEANAATWKRDATQALAVEPGMDGTSWE